MRFDRKIFVQPLRLAYSKQAQSPSFPTTFVINLAHRVDRWKFITAELKKTKIEIFFRFPAVVGAEQNLDQCFQKGVISPFGLSRLKLPQHEKIWGMDLTLGGLGCALSHIEIWKIIIALQLEKAMVVEDDTEFAPDFLRRFSCVVREFPVDWELVFLSGLDVQHQCPQLLVSPHLSHVPQLYRTTNLYLITHKGAKELLKYCCPMHFQLDTQMTLNAEEKKKNGNVSKTNQKVCLVVKAPKMYACVPCLAIQRTSFGTDVQGAMPPTAAAEERERRRQAGW